MIFPSIRRSSCFNKLVILVVIAVAAWVVFRGHGYVLDLDSTSIPLEPSVFEKQIRFKQENYPWYYSDEDFYTGRYYLPGDKQVSDDEVLAMQRRNIYQEIRENPFHPDLAVYLVNSLVPALGGRVVSTLVVTSWRSAYTFLGEVLNAHPSTFYYYEPVDPEGIRAVDQISQLFHCNYTGMEPYLEFANKRSRYIIAPNKRLWWICKVFMSFCERPDFLSVYCKLFPFNLAKVDLMRMAQTKPLLEDHSLAVRVVMLVRDPRATSYWCHRLQGCVQPQKLCANLVSDFYAALHLHQIFPGRVLIIRYEDLVDNAFNVTRETYDFLSLNFSAPVQQYIKDHPNSEQQRQWRTQLSFQEVADIQFECQEAMNLYGYRFATEADDLEHFDLTDEFNFPPPWRSA